MIPRSIKIISLFSTALTAISINTPAAAQDANAYDFGLEEIIVTARRRSESVQDIPLTVQAFSASEIERRQIRTVEDVAKYTPGFIIDRGISLQDVRPSIRGLPATRGRPPVGILVDGIDISTESLGNAGGGNLLNLRLLDLERIEVVKGPQSALYGRAAFAGAVNYVSRRPSDELEVDLSLAYGRFDTVEVRGSVSGPIVEDVLKVRLNAAHAESDGDYNNPVSDGNLNDYQSTGVGLAVEYTPTEDLTIYGRATYTDDQAGQRAIQALSGFTGAVSRPGPDTAAGQAVAVGNASGALLSAFGPAQPSNVPQFGALTFDGVTGLSLNPETGQDFQGSDSSTILANLNIEYDMGFATLVSLTGYASQNDRLQYDGDFFGLAATQLDGGIAEPLELFDAVDFDNEYRQISQEIRIQNFDGERLRWAVGGLYWNSQMDQQNGSLRANGGFSFDGFTPSSAALSGSTIFANSIDFSVPQGRDITSWSFYGLVEYNLLDNLTVTAEARYIDEKQTVTRSGFTQTPGNPFAGVPFGPLLAPLDPMTEVASVSDNDFLPRVTVNYDFTNDVTVYASASKGFKPGGVSELNFGTPLEDSRFLKETLWNYEAGFKSSLFDNQMVFNAAGFYMDWTNLQSTRLIPNPETAAGVSNEVINAGGARVLGLDISASYAPNIVEGLRMNVGYTFLDTKYTDFTQSATTGLPVTEAGECITGTEAGVPVCFIDFAGNELERAPRHSITTNVYYERPVSDDITAFVDLAVQYTSDRFQGAANNFILESFINADMNAGIRGDNWTVQFYGTNIFGDDTVRQAQQNFDLSTFGRSVNMFAPPRTTYGVRVGYNY